MYVVNKGLLEVLGGPDGITVIGELKSGSAFGEIRYCGFAGRSMEVCICVHGLTERSV